jgi:hypothetical protein
MNIYNNKRDKSILIQQGFFQIVLYFSKDWFLTEFNKTYAGWYIRLNFFKLGFNFYYK